MVVGVIYKYTSPSGKVYIGQTTDERHRRSCWFSSCYKYAGLKINKARLKYGPENFHYEILHKKYYFNKYQALLELNYWESYYIGYYDSFKHGYNNSIGGLGARGYVVTENAKQAIRQKKRNYVTSERTKQKISKANKGRKLSIYARESRIESRRNNSIKPVYLFNNNGVLIHQWRNALEAALFLNIVDKNIYRAVKTLTKYKECFWRDSPIFLLSPKKGNFSPIVKCNLNGDILQTFDSIKEAASSINKLPTLISRCLNGKRESAYGFIWKYKNI